MVMIAMSILILVLSIHFILKQAILAFKISGFSKAKTSTTGDNVAK
jgi:hypothetical protein